MDLRGKTANVTRPDMLTKGTGNRVDDGHGVEFIPNFGSMPEVAGNPIVERGSNADGNWIRYADGTQLASHESTSPSAQSAYRWDFSYPASWVGNPHVAGAGRNNGTSDRGYEIGTTRNINNTSGTVYIRNRDSYAGSNINVNYIAIGRWF